MELWWIGTGWMEVPTKVTLQSPPQLDMREKIKENVHEKREAELTYQVLS